MKATIPYIEKKFDEFNRRIFGGKLPRLPIELSDAKTFLGVCVYKKRRMAGGKTERFGFKLRINTRIDLTEREIEDTIIHEMIHYYIGVNQLEDTGAHGQLFRQMMNTINEKFGRHLTVSHRMTREQREQSIDRTPRYRVIAVVKFKNGTTGIKVIPRILQRILDYYRKVSGHQDVERVELFMSDNPFFNRYPNSSILTVHFLDGRTIMENLKDADKLEFDGSTLTFG